MSTISRKNPQIMAQDFLRDFRQFESYLKHCINILKTQVWLKDNQFNEEISNYDYITELFYKLGNNPLMLMNLYSFYKKDVIDKLPKENIVKVSTNKYYIDGLSSFVQSFSNFSNDNLIGDNLPETKKTHQFNRLFHLMYCNHFEFDQSCEYSEGEILNLISQGKAFIIESAIEKSEISEQEIINRLNEGTIEFVDRDFTGGYVFASNTGDVFDWFETANEEERRIWFAKNLLFMNYIRKNRLSFNKNIDKKTMLDCCYSFDITINHIDRIIAEMKKLLKKKKGADYNKFWNLIKEIVEEKDLLKTVFDSDSPLIEILPKK